MRPIHPASGPPPPIEEYRPTRCEHCGRWRLHGHGLRRRWLVLAAHRGRRLLQIWVRRFLCPHCSKTVTVLPDGVWPGFLYSVEAIVYAWVLATLQGQSDRAVYAQQGVDRLSVEGHRSGRQRWRSLARWSRQIEERWPEVYVAGRTWRERAARLVLHLVTTGHAPCGAVM